MYWARTPRMFLWFHNETGEHFFFLNVHFILPLELILSPLLLAYLLTGGFLLLKHKFYQFLCLDHRYRPGAK